jgi:hypothetical protein
MDYSKKFVKLNLVVEVTGIVPEALLVKTGSFLEELKALAGDGEVSVSVVSIVTYPDHTEAQG